MRGRRNLSAGFTLVEILVALVILSMLMIGLVAAVRFSMDAWRRQSQALAEAGRLEAVDHALRGIVSDAYGGFAGDGRIVTFDGLLPLAVPEHLRRAHIVISVDGSGHLVLQWTARLPPASGGQPAEGKIVLLDGVSGLSIAYWVLGDSAGANQGWRDRVEDGALPRLLRLRVLFERPPPQPWPDMIFAPRVAEHSE